jgi:soluble lytic murein transglycosylase
MFFGGCEANIMMMRFMNIFKILLVIWFIGCNAFAEGDFNFTKKDYNLFNDCIILVEKGKIRESFNKAKTSNNLLITKIMNWFFVKDAASGANFNEITKFIKDNPHWPQQDRLEINAELALNESTDDQKIIDWFKTREPMTSRAMKLLVEASVRKNNITTSLIKKYWINGDFDSKQQNEFLSKYNKIITEEDHIERINRLLWDNKLTQVKSLINKAPKDYQKLFLARMVLDKKSISLVSEKLKKDPGLLYDIALKYQNDQDYNNQTNILKNIKNPKDHQKQWWSMKSKLIRELLKDKKYQDAYELSINHNNISNSDASDADWMAGWIALRFLDDAKSASKHFKTMYDRVKYPVSVARASYWLGRATENSQDQISWYEIAASHPETYYGQLAIIKLNQKYLKLPKAIIANDIDKSNYQKNELAKAAFLLAKSDKFHHVKSFNKSAIEAAKSTGEVMLINEMSSKFGNLHVLVETAKHTAKEKKIFTKLSYPTLNNIVSHEEEKPLILSIIRQESVFDHQAQSPAGALGFMQLMPKTAKQASRELRIPFKHRALTSDKIYNIKLGTHSLKKLISYYDGSYILAIAAYNAGEGNVNKWLKEYGDPRGEDLDKIIDWLEIIPFYETRNYLHRVLENLQIYRVVTVTENTSKELSLDKDLKR